MNRLTPSFLTSALFWRAFTACLAVGLLSCASVPSKSSRRLSFSEAGLAAPPSGSSRSSSAEVPALEHLTGRLLAAIENETGQRPALGGDEAFVAARTWQTRRHAAGWNAERTAVASEVLRATDAREATVRGLRRAQAALRWDRLAAVRIPEVDRMLVAKALARIDAVLPVPVEAPTLTLAWPVDPARITSDFGVRLDPVARKSTRLHSGVDLMAVEGQAVFAAAAGEVVFAGRRGGYGRHVDIAHIDGVVTRYAHLSEIEVRVHDQVAFGALVGRAGQSGRVTGPHLHFEVWRDELPVNPVDELPVLLDGSFLSRF